MLRLIYKVSQSVLNLLGFSGLRPAQEEPLQSILRWDDTFVVLPTGGGKSALFQIPALMDRERMFHSLTLVISPLRALQADQIKALKDHGIAAELLNSDLPKAERERVLKQMPDLALLYLAPEQLKNSQFLAAAKSCRIRRVFVDEAHVLPEAELGFRPAYGEIGAFITSLPRRPQVVALTATATPKEQAIIVQSLGMRDVAYHRFPIRRANLHLIAKKLEFNAKHHKKSGAEALLFEMVRYELKRLGDKDGSAIIFCPTIERTENLAKHLNAAGFKCSFYHGKLSAKERNAAQDKFVSGKQRVIVATNAFGLGVDMPHVRLIIHAGMPLTMPGYVQEVGRAGRDGRDSRCVLFWSESDFSNNARIIKTGSSPEAAKRTLADAQVLWDLLHSKECLWQGIEAAYGYEPGKRCKSCSHCK